MVTSNMKLSRSIFFPLLLVFVLLFAQQAGAAHALHHALEDLTQQEGDKQAHHSDVCEQCANYLQLGSALNVGAYEFTRLIVSSEAIQHGTTTFRSIHALAAVARGPPSLLQSFA
jgi:hypothetical protein